MDLLIDYRNENNIGIFHLEGERHYNDAKEAWSSFYNAIHKDILKAVLVFDNAKSYLSPIDIVNLESYLREIAFPRDIKVALVDPKLTVDCTNRFGETVALNRGWYNIKIFREESRAREWLEESTK